VQARRCLSPPAIGEQYTRRVGPDAERVSERIGAHRGDHGRADGHPEILERPRHRAAIDAHAKSIKSIFLPVQRQAVAQLVARHVREQRWCRDRTR